jgi:type 1 fimbria pilin
MGSAVLRLALVLVAFAAVDLLGVACKAPSGGAASADGSDTPSTTTNQTVGDDDDDDNASGPSSAVRGMLGGTNGCLYYKLSVFPSTFKVQTVNEFSFDMENTCEVDVTLSGTFNLKVVNSADTISRPRGQRPFINKLVRAGTLVTLDDLRVSLTLNGATDSQLNTMLQSEAVQVSVVFTGEVIGKTVTVNPESDPLTVDLDLSAVGGGQ